MNTPSLNNQSISTSGSIMVIGGVVAGVQAALDLSELVTLNGKSGCFTARIKKRPRYIDTKICTGCGQCTLYCLKQIGDDYNENLQISHTAHIDHAQAVPASYHIDPKTCLRLSHQTCGLCAVVCRAGAIRFEDQEEMLDISVGAVVLAPEFGRVSEEVLRSYGWGKFDDMRTYGFTADDYRKARKLVVIFTRYTPDRPPTVTVNKDGRSKPLVKFFNPILGDELERSADLLILATGIEADAHPPHPPPPHYPNFSRYRSAVIRFSWRPMSSCDRWLWRWTAFLSVVWPIRRNPLMNPLPRPRPTQAGHVSREMMKTKDLSRKAIEALVQQEMQ